MEDKTKMGTDKKELLKNQQEKQLKKQQEKSQQEKQQKRKQQEKQQKRHQEKRQQRNQQEGEDRKNKTTRKNLRVVLFLLLFYSFCMLIDEVTIEVKGGKGGDGRVHFDTSRSREGADGGNGGDGGSVYVVGVSDLLALRQFRHKKRFYAQDGKMGGTKKKAGKFGENVVLKVPVGSVLKSTDGKKEFEILNVGEKVLIAKGGRGGKGNAEFKSSTRRSPKIAQKGKEGEHFFYKIELKLIADIGFVGLPNAGKSSLLNALTKSEAKVGNYPFTTLEPNLGEMDGIIIADIPGLIEGASKGRGLGVKFLKHIQRTKAIVHLISLESDDLMRDYISVLDELKKFDEGLPKKEKLIILTKSDLFDERTIKEKLKNFSPKKEIFTASILNKDDVKKIREKLKTLIF